MHSEVKVFDLVSARELLPWVREVTHEAAERVRKIRQEFADPESAQSQLGQIIHHWADTITKLGATPKRPFTVDFDTGEDFLCWAYPENDIRFRHSYDQGFADRYPIEESL